MGGGFPVRDRARDNNHRREITMLIFVAPQGVVWWGYRSSQGPHITRGLRCLTVINDQRSGPFCSQHRTASIQISQQGTRRKAAPGRKHRESSFIFWYCLLLLLFHFCFIFWLNISCCHSLKRVLTLEYVCFKTFFNGIWLKRLFLETKKSCIEQVMKIDGCIDKIEKTKERGKCDCQSLYN